jgi:hypothetical protein
MFKPHVKTCIEEHISQYSTYTCSNKRKVIIAGIMLEKYEGI